MEHDRHWFDVDRQSKGNPHRRGTAGRHQYGRLSVIQLRQQHRVGGKFAPLVAEQPLIIEGHQLQ